MDGIDVALIDTDGRSIVEFGPVAEYPYSGKTRHKIEQGLLDAVAIASDRAARPATLERLEQELTGLHVDAVQDFLQRNNIAPDTVDIIGFHGQTVLHRPHQALTVQLGDGAWLARKTGIDVVCDMRAADMVAGGQGAPLVPVYHQALASMPSLGWDQQKPVAFVNIGGISNITWVPPVGEPVAFDTGPGNALIDQWMEENAGEAFDNNGDTASRGMLVGSILEHYLSTPYFERTLPKSLDRNDFEPLAKDDAGLADGARTLARVTAEAVYQATRLLPQMPGLWIICGGGRKNRMIMQDIQELTQQTGGRTITAEQAGLNGDSMEAEAFAYLAVRSLTNLPLTFPGTTGCKSQTTGGVFHQA